MVPQGHIPPAASVLGTIGTMYVSGTLIKRMEPLIFIEDAGLSRIWYNWRRKSTEGLPGIMPFLWGAAGVPFGAYTIVQEFNVPLQIQPQILICLCLVCWGQTLFYHNKYKIAKASYVTIVTIAILAGLEALLVFVIRPPYKRGISWPITLIGVVAAILLASGLVPPYFEFAKTKGRVIGIDFLFLSIDFAGGLFSLLALVAQQTFDVLGGTQYIAVMLLELGIFASHSVWLRRTRQIRREAKFVGMSYDDYVGYGEPKVLMMTEKRSGFGAQRLRYIKLIVREIPRHTPTGPTRPTPQTAQTQAEMIPPRAVEEDWRIAAERSQAMV